MKFPQGITMSRETRFGKPILAGTRVPVEIVVGKIAGGMAVDTIMKEYELTKRQVLAALKYAANIVASEEVSVA